MTRKLFHSLVILVLTLFATQGGLMLAQSADDGGGRRATSSQIPESERDAGAIEPAKAKVYEFRSIDYPRHKFIRLL